MTDLRTDKELLDAISAAARHKPTADELFRQRVSYIYGSLRNSSTVTREKITDVLAAHEGRVVHK